MQPIMAKGRWFLPACLLVLLAGNSSRALAQATILSIEGGTNAWITPRGTSREVPAFRSQRLDPGDRGHTGSRTRLTLQLADRSHARIREHSHFEIQKGAGEKEPILFTLRRGLGYFFLRGEPGELLIRSRGGTAASRGTEFVVEVDEEDGLLVTLVEGEVVLTNEHGLVRLVNRDPNWAVQALARPGQQPQIQPKIAAINAVQWCLYYPGVLDPGDLPLTDFEARELGDSLAAYRAGDLAKALTSYPGDQPFSSASAKIYLAVLLLAVGEVEQAEQLLPPAPRPAIDPEPDRVLKRLAGAVRQMIAAVRHEPWDQTQPPALATEWLAESYFLQAQSQAPGNVTRALQAARSAVAVSRDFGFGWVRVAELEFSRGNTAEARRALEEGLRLAPRNAQALALKGFLLSAQNQVDWAYLYFDEAIRADGGLANGWLGRGLAQMKLGHTRAGLADLEVAAAVEPQRALLRSYLSKAFGQAGDTRRARTEIELAKQLDENDPTSWLYSALLHWDDNHVNEAVADLKTSKERNDNRRVYRSQLLLDQDQAVRGANLAAIYRDAGMIEVSLREAAQAVNLDYANFSSHLLLANSLQERRDPNQVQLRFETAWFTEYLLANLLSPPGASTLSQAVSEHEYSRLFERNRLGLYSSTDYLSYGEWQQNTVQYGVQENSSYAAELFYRQSNGQRPNSDVEQLAATIRAKQQITPQDSLFLQISYADAEAGDVMPYYDPAQASLHLRTEEVQQPSFLAGYHREWSPGSHTLLLAGYWEDTLQYSTPDAQALFLDRSVQTGQIFQVTAFPAEQNAYRNEVQIFSGELQHILQWDWNSLQVGGRFQEGTFFTTSDQSLIFLGQPIPQPLQDYDLDFQRLSLYAYDQCQIWSTVPLRLVAGLSYDRITYPSDFRFPPISSGEDKQDQLSPKAGFIWTPTKDTTLRAAYTRSLGGASLDQSVRLEPSQVAGFIQSFRSLIPEAVGGALSAPSFETYGLSLEQKVSPGTYLGVALAWLKSEVDHVQGAYEFDLNRGGLFQSGTQEDLDFDERSLTLTANQLLGREWSLGAFYRISAAELDQRFPEIPASAFTGNVSHDQALESTLHFLRLFAIYNHPVGFFAEFDANYYHQSNAGYSPAQPGDHFWQLDAFVGYRLPRRKAELRVGLLNLTDQDYRLSPLNLTPELPRDRTFATTLRFHF
jgi:outer membrane receptor protein involved in Fe transport